MVFKEKPPSPFLLKGSDNLDGVLDNLENAIRSWAEKLAEIWNLLTQDPTTFRGGTIWSIIQRIHRSLKAVGLKINHPSDCIINARHNNER